MTLHTGRFMTLILSAFVLISVSCEGPEASDVRSDKDMGKIVLKSAMAVSDIDDYNFRFVGVDGYGSSPYYRFGDVSWPMEWYFGVFRLQAESCTYDEAEVGYGKLRYEGTGEPFSVINDQVASASVVCSVANFNVTVSFDNKMYEAFGAMKMTVNSVLAPLPVEDEEGNVVEFDQSVLRSLELDAIHPTGYYNAHVDRVILKYTVYVRLDGAEEYIVAQEGYYTEDGSDEPAAIKAGDAITFNVSYSGDAPVTEHIKFIVSGEKNFMPNTVSIGDYTQGTVEEDE